MNKKKIKEKPEDSISLRFITSAMAIVGILAACQLAETPPTLTLFGIFGTAIGSYVSYVRRDKNNFWIKWAIAAGILVVQGFFVEEVMYRVQASIADARAPLTNMLIGLQALHSFDLPRRRDMNVSALVGMTLLASAATLSRDLTFGLYLLAFICFGAYMLYLDCVSRTIEGTDSEQQFASGIKFGASKSAGLAMVCIMPILAVSCFLLLPRMDIGLLHNVRVSLKLHLPMLDSNRVTNPLLSHTKLGDGSMEVSPLAYFGFDENLDLNYRGALSDQVVMKVSCSRGEFWRAMAFDTYDGHKWSMSKPKQTFNRLTSYGSAIPLAPLTGLFVPRRVPTIELTQVFEMQVDQTNLIPTASIPSLIYFPANKVQVDSYGSLRSPVLMEKDMVYTVISNVPQYDLDVLRQAEPVSEATAARVKRAHPNDLQLPENLPDSVRYMSKAIAGEDGNWFVKAERFDRHLKENFKYNLNVPPTDARDDVVADFLMRKKSGYCEHFASSFVVLCRAAGIPARMVTGFTSGEYNPFTGLWEVRMRDAHAWAEVFVPRWGWVPFDPTPDGAPPGFQGTTGHSALEFVTERIGKLFKDFAKTETAKQLWGAVSGAAGPVLAGVSWFFYFAGALWQPIVIAMAVFALAALCWKVLPRLALRIPRRSSNDSSMASKEMFAVCQELEKLDIRRQPQDTGQEFLARVRERMGEEPSPDSDLPDLVEQFLSDYSAARFGAGSPSRDLSGIRGKIHERVLFIRTRKRQWCNK
jgi:protein-glutamine gamma-glutamyltransferase